MQKMEKHNMCTVIKYLGYIERTDDTRFFDDMKETLTESAVAYSKVVKCHAEFTQG